MLHKLVMVSSEDRLSKDNTAAKSIETQWRLEIRLETAVIGFYLMYGFVDII